MVYKYIKNYEMWKTKDLICLKKKKLNVEAKRN